MDHIKEDTEGTVCGEPFRIGPVYVEHWMHEFSHWDHSPSVGLAVEALGVSLRNLLELRDKLQRARGEFGPVSSLYPQNHPTENQRQRMYDTTAGFFDGFYTALDKLASLVSQHSDVFGHLPHRKMQKFITSLRPFALFADVTLPLLEDARRFRTMTAHGSSLPPHTWITGEVAQFDIRLIFIGRNQRDGNPPEGAIAITDAEGELSGLNLGGGEGGESMTAEWYSVAPDEELVVWALCVQLNALVGRIMANRDNSSVVTCPWVPPFDGDDTGAPYPIFSPMDGEVVDTWTTDFILSATTIFASEDEGEGSSAAPDS